MGFLAQALLSRAPALVMILGYRNAMYDHHLRGWRTSEFQAMTRGGVRTETVWMNFEPGRAFTGDYAGLDFIERQRIKRKAASWSRRYAALPPGERAAVLSSILAVERRH